LKTEDLVIFKNDGNSVRMRGNERARAFHRLFNGVSVTLMERFIVTRCSRRARAASIEEWRVALSPLVAGVDNLLFCEVSLGCKIERVPKLSVVDGIAMWRGSPRRRPGRAGGAWRPVARPWLQRMASASPT